MSQTVEQALGEFELVPGVGSEKDKKACAMSLLAHVRGEGFTDHPQCAHDILSNAVIHAFDHRASTAVVRLALTLSGLEHLGYCERRSVPSQADPSVEVDVWRRTVKGDKAIR